MCDKIRQLKLEFTNALKTVLKENISKNPVTLLANRDRITLAYNNLITEIRNLYPLVNDHDKVILKDLFNKSRERIGSAYSVLNCNYLIPEDFHSLICPNTRDVKDPTSQPFENISQIGSPKPPIVRPQQFNPLAGTSAQNFEEPKPQSLPQNFNNNTFDSDPEVEMADLNPVEFLKLCSTKISRNYNGNPLALQSFLDSIDLLAMVATNENLKNILYKFILSVLEDKARDCITPEHNTTDLVIRRLKSKIKCESSKVIEGRMQALRADRVKLQDFSKQADELAECFRRSLVMEGIPPEKAQEMTIDKTVDMCRASARSDLAKAVLASTTFSDPKEVVAKFLVEINSESKEKQVMTFRSQRSPNSFQNRNPRPQSNNFQHSRHTNFRQNFNNNRSNNYSQNSRFQYRNNSQNNQFRPQNYSRSYNNQHNFNNQSRRPNVRFLENLEAPQWQQGQERLGEDVQFPNQDQH